MIYQILHLQKTVISDQKTVFSTVYSILTRNSYESEAEKRISPSLYLFPFCCKYS